MAEEEKQNQEEKKQKAPIADSASEPLKKKRKRRRKKKKSDDKPKGNQLKQENKHSKDTEIEKGDNPKKKRKRKRKKKQVSADAGAQEVKVPAVGLAPVADGSETTDTEPISPDFDSAQGFAAQPPEFEASTEQPAGESVEQAAPSPFDAPSEPVGESVEQAAPSPFDAPSEPVGESVEQAAPSPFDAPSEPAGESVEQAAPSPFDAPSEPVGESFEQAAPSPFDAPPSPFDAQPEEPNEPFRDDISDEPSITTESEETTEAQQPIEAEVLSSSTEKIESEPDAEESGFDVPDETGKRAKGGESFWQALQEAGVSKGLIIKSCLGLLVITVLIVAFFSFGGFDLFKFSGDSNGGQETPQDTTGQSVSDKSVDVPRNDPNGLKTSLLFGYNQGSVNDVVLPPPIKVGNQLGKIQEGPFVWRGAISNASEIGFPSFQDRIGGDYRILTAIDLLRAVTNAYNTNIHALIDSQVDRSAALEAHINKLIDLYNDSKEMKVVLDRENQIIRATFDNLVPQKEQSEMAFFTNLSALSPDATANNLATFISLSKEMIELKARYKALTRLSEHYGVILQRLRARIRDLEENRDALIKGVKVYDVPASDIDLIVPVELSDLDDIPS